MNDRPDPRTATLFRPFTVGPLQLANRIVMAPMTRGLSPGHVPGPDVAAYYRRRAEGGVGLIITEGTYINHPGAGFHPGVPQFHGEAALAGWRHVAEQVHAAGGRIFPQIWHVGLTDSPGAPMNEHAIGPSGLVRTVDFDTIEAQPLGIGRRLPERGNHRIDLGLAHRLASLLAGAHQP